MRQPGTKQLKKVFKEPFFVCGFLALVLIYLLWIVSLPQKENFLVTKVTPNSGSPFISQNNVSYLESPDLYFIQGTSLKAISVPTTLTPKVLGSLVGSNASPEPSKEIIEYTIEPGDTLSSIAQRFNISLETILWANNLSIKSVLKPGKKLIILPISGVLHHVKEGETISHLAEKYHVKAEDIINFNQLSVEGEIFVGDILIVPHGRPPIKTLPAEPTWHPLPSSYFICPIPPPCTLSQGLHWYNAVDLTHGQCGQPIYAAAAGKVLRVNITESRSPNAFGGAGNHLTILHPNGVVTFYGHLARVLVRPGQEVSQGQIIAQMGGAPGTPGAGRSTGCHLHFGVHGAKNPFAP